MSEDGEAVEGLIPKIQEAFDKYTQGSVSVIDKQNGGLNSTFEILQDLSKVYPTLTDEAKAYLNEAIAGNRQNKVLVAIMENWKNVESSINAATNSLGSANRENEKYLNSINGKISQFNSSVQMLFKNTIDSNFIKWVVDTGTAVISLVDKLGLIPTVIGAATLAFALFSKTAFAGIMSKLASVIVTKLVVSLHMATGAAVGLATALSVLAPVAIATAILAIISGIKYLAEATERQREVVRKLKEEYDTLTTSLDENESKQQKVIDRLKELYALRNTNKITDVEKEELIRLENVNTELQRQIEYEKALKAIKGEALERETLELSDKKIYRSRTQIPEIKQGRSYELPPMLTLSEKAQEDLNIIKDYTTQIEELKSARDEDKISAEEYGKQLEELQLKRKNEIESLNELIAKIAEENEGYGSTEEGNKKKAANEAIIKSIQDYIISLNAEKNALDGLAKPSSDAGSAAQAQAKSVEELTKIYDSATDTIDDYSSSAKELASVYEDVNEGEKISSDTLLKLITQYPQYASQIANLNSSKEAGISITKLLWEVEKQRSIEKLKADRLELESERDKLEGYRKAYIALSNIMGSVPQGVLDSYKQYENINKQIGGITEAINILNNTAIDTFSSKKSKKSSKSEYTPSSEQSALKELLDAEKISLQEYYNRLLALEKSQYSDYADKSASQLEGMLRSKNENVAKRTEEYLALFNELASTQNTILESSLSSLSNQYDSGTISIEKYISALETLKKQVGLTNEQLENINSTILDLSKSQQESLQKKAEEEIKLYEDTQSKIIELIKDRYDEEDKVRTRNHEDALQEIEDEKQAYSDYINDRINALDSLADKEDYDKNVSEQSKVITDIQKEIDKYSLAADSGDMEAIAKVAELRKQKTEEESKLTETQTKRDRELRKKNLQDNLKNYEDYLDKKKRDEEDSFNQYKRNLQDATEDTALQLEAQRLLMQGTVLDAQNALITLFTQTNANATMTGKILQDQIISKLAQIRDIGGNLTAKTGQTAGNNPLGMNKSDFKKYVDNKKEFETGNASASRLEELNKENERLRKKYGIKGDFFSYKQLVGYYKDGGINTTTGLAMLHGTPTKPEWILNTDQMKKLINSLAFSNITPKVNVPNFSNINSRGNTIQISSLINIEGNATRDSIPLIKNAGMDIINKLKGKGVVINNV